MESRLIYIFLILLSGFAQAGYTYTTASDPLCRSGYSIRLQNQKGGFFEAQKLVFTSSEGTDTQYAVSDHTGLAKASLLCATVYHLRIGNYTRPMEIRSAPAGGNASQTLSYAADMAAREKRFEMSAAEIARVEQCALQLSDTVLLKEVLTLQKQFPDCFVRVEVELHDPEKKPLAGETVCFSANGRSVSFLGRSNAEGKLLFYLLKGDSYSLSFVCQKDFATEEFPFSKGMAVSELGYVYIGTPAHRKRIREEELRLKKEEELLKKEKADFAAWCKKRKISEEEGYKLKWSADADENNDTVIPAVMRRMNWQRKLLVCDVSGSMQAYIPQLLQWFSEQGRREPGLRFVLFNDGDDKPDESKVCGQTGGVYDGGSPGSPDSLQNLIARVMQKGSGGDCPENNMEALLKAVGWVPSFGQLVLIADNDAPVRDIALLKGFRHPVRIILCGAFNTAPACDYLDIARSTGGSVHTLLEDFTGLQALAEGAEIRILAQRYRIMGGRFIALP